VSTTSPNCVSVSQIEVKAGRLTRIPLAQFIIDEGKIAGFEVHPSKDYLLVTSTHGRIYVFRIDTGELRGSIEVPNHARGCLIDPSGLYVVVQVPPLSQQLAAPNNLNLGIHENDIERTTLLIFEIGTGMPAFEIRSVFEVSSMQFSENGKYLALGSSHGAVEVFPVDPELHQNVKQVLDSMKIQPDFWYNYPIFLPNYDVVSTQKAAYEDMSERIILSQADKPETFESFSPSRSVYNNLASGRNAAVDA